MHPKLGEVRIVVTDATEPLSVICGILMAHHLNTPSGPSIVFSGVIGFITIFAIRSKKFNS